MKMENMTMHKKSADSLIKHICSAIKESINTYFDVKSGITAGKKVRAQRHLDARKKY